MRRYVALRLSSLVPILLGVSLVVFSMQHLVPGDIVDIVSADIGQGDREAAARLRSQLRLDRPLVEQYGLWLRDAVTGNLGASFVSGRPVTGEILRRLPVNLELAGLAMGFAILVGVPVGALAAVCRGSWLDASIRVVAVLGYSVPNFWVATLTVLVGSLWLPRMPILAYVPFSESPARNLLLMAIPSLVLSLTILPLIVRMTRVAVLENLRHDYVRTARAKGLPERSVVLRHVLANSLVAVLNVTGVQVGVLIGGLVLTEEIFILPGLGRLLLESVQKRDFPVVTGVILFLAAAYVTINLVVDLLHGLLDPRVRG